MVARAVTKKITDLPLYSLNTNQGNILYSEGGVNYQYPMSGIVKNSFTFTVGGTLRSNTDRISDGTYLYYWTGEYPVTVTAGSTLDTLGGIGTGYWAPDTDIILRDYLSSVNGAQSIGLALGGTVNDSLNWVIPENFGIDYSDGSSGLQAAMDYAVSVGKPLKVLGKKIILKSQITIPTQLVADFSGSLLISDAAITSGATILVDGYGSVVAGKYSGNITGLVLLRALTNGHADTTSNVDGISFIGASGQSSDMKWLYTQVYGFRDNLRYDGPNTYLNQFIGGRFGFAWRRGIAVYANVNSNENYGFIGGSVFNCNNTTGTGVGVYIDPAASGTDLYFSGGFSFDYCDQSILQYQSTINCTNCHFENNNNNPHVTLSYTGTKEKPIFIANGGTMGGGPGVVSWGGTAVEQSGGRPYYIYVAFNGQSSVHIYGTKCGGYLSGVRRNTQLVKVQYNGINALNSIFLRPILDAGNTDTSSRPMRLCDAINALAISTLNLNSWVQSYGSGSTTYVFSTDTTTYYDSDSPSSRKYVGTVGTNNTGLYQEIPCFAGSIINCHVEVNIPTLTQGYLALWMDFYDFNGNVISSTIKTITAATSGWVQLWVYQMVPNGTVKVRFQEYYNSFIGTAYFSNENLWFH